MVSGIVGVGTESLFRYIVVVGGVVFGVITNRVPTQNLRTVVGIDLLFLIDWHE